ncbi:SagB family peptide dehydrogenase [Nonomuraea jiangxiensis]|uniref:SagB-type dehydrogenase domain-containing protein n=1 Tax=Nonomuraea jiangxiensis TaxID=633440 RepID=A0A1G9P3U3_9ACTN|nr:SagB family peptide dehydrogenase [Nonomuraea jiangxiensis]SDL92897.1 SagB-type dehydrogenase domain-containing protein [Nonomuraea jiangxiensis]
MHTTTAASEAGAATRRYLAAMRDRGPLVIDWAGAPTRHKRYPGAARARLPWAAGDGSALGLIGELLRDLLGMTRLVWSHQLDDRGEPLGRPPMLITGRPAPSGGGLYPIEAYVAAGVPGLPSALYHYDPVHHVLERVRGGDHVPALAGLLADGPVADVVVVLSGVFWRSMFKYGDFGYRLICQETGVLIAQALAVGGRLGLAGRACLRFPDGEVNRLLGLDGTREAALAVLTLSLPPGNTRHPNAKPPDAGPPYARPPDAEPPDAEPPPPSPSAGELMARPVAGESTPLPKAMPDGLAAALHRACTSTSPTSPTGPPEPAEAEALRPRLPARPGRAVPAPGPATGIQAAASGVPRRTSPLAGYRPVPLMGAALGAVLAAAGGGYPADLPGAAAGPAMTALCLLSLRVEGLPRGAYWYDPARHTLHELAGAEQVDAVATGRLLANTRVALRGAAAVLVPVGDPVAGARLFGDRWYRMQQMEAGLVAQRATLAAVALGLAARIHSDGANETTDEVLTLAGTPLRSLSFLVLGTPPTGGPLVARPVPALVREEVMPVPTTS